MPLQLQVTKDLSHTLYVPELDETYHSRNGALEEALYVYLDKGFHHVRETAHSKQSMHVLEMGFGTGLNAWLTAMAASAYQIPCVYESIEAFPVDTTLIEQLNYTENASESDQNLFHRLHQADWNVEQTISPVFRLHKHHTTLQTFEGKHPVDVIYFDAFAPEKQPELWTEDLFAKLFQLLAPGGIMVTYSSKGAVRRIWESLGFDVERLPGPPFKRHMLRATKPLE